MQFVRDQIVWFLLIFHEMPRPKTKKTLDPNKESYHYRCKTEGPLSQNYLAWVGNNDGIHDVTRNISSRYLFHFTKLVFNQTKRPFAENK